MLQLQGAELHPPQRLSRFKKSPMIKMAQIMKHTLLMFVYSYGYVNMLQLQVVSEMFIIYARIILNKLLVSDMHSCNFISLRP